jgi:rhodanese-related sulfurtransferase
MNVVVHCHAGICRSGAVCEVGVMMGFTDCERFRAPNLLVKHKMMRVLGWTYDSEEKSYDVHGTTNEWGFITPNKNHEGDI